MNWDRDILHRTAIDIGEYVYHGTNEDVLDAIIKEGLKPMHRGLLSFSKTMPYAESFALEGMTPYGKTNKVMLRVKSNYFKNGFEPMDNEKPETDRLYEVLTKDVIPPQFIEILKDGTWIPLLDMIKEGTHRIAGKTIILYHGTHPKFVEGIKANGLTNVSFMQGWFTLATDFNDALFHATPDEEGGNVAVIEFEIPMEGKKPYWPGQPWLWPASDMGGKEWYAIMQPIPASFIRKVYDVPYEEWVKGKEKGL